MTRWFAALLLVPLLAAAAPAATTPDEHLPVKADSVRWDSSLEELLQTYVEGHRQSVGMAATLISSNGVSMATAGRTRARGSGAPSPESHFEIGSITKVFTGLLLADMVERGEVTLETTLRELIPDPERLDSAVARITLRELATHTSGLPRLPLHGPMLRRMVLRPGHPYHGSEPHELFQAVAELEAHDLETRGSFAYSNLGPALLGRLLEEAAETLYEDLLEERILDRFDLHDTHFTLQVLDSPSLARGHRENLRPTRNWILDAYVPAGGLASTLQDMTRFLQQAMAGDDELLRRSFEPLWTGGGAGPDAGMGWILDTLDDEPFYWHNGRTGGYHAFLGFLPESERGIVVLSNTSHQGDALAVSLLRGEGTLPEPERSLFWTAFTMGLLVMAPWVAYGRRRELDAMVRGTAHRPRGSIHLLAGGADVALFLALAHVLGRWQWIPDLAWWLALVLSAGLLATALGTARRLPWLPSEGGWKRFVPLAGTILSLAFTTWLVLGL